MRTPSQQRAIERIFHYAGGIMLNSLEASIEFAGIELTEQTFGITFKVETHRNDCHEFSPRQVFCRQGFTGCIYKGGRIELWHDNSIREDHDAELRHHARMLHGSVRKF
jgi:hypothetical protein